MIIIQRVPDKLSIGISKTVRYTGRLNETKVELRVQPCFRFYRLSVFRHPQVECQEM